MFIPEGDASAQMTLDNLFVIASEHPRYLFHAASDGGAYESIGGQPPISCAFELVNAPRAPSAILRSVLTKLRDWRPL